MTDVYGALNGASALAANGIFRYTLGAVFPLFTVQCMYSVLSQYSDTPPADNRPSVFCARNSMGYIAPGLLVCSSIAYSLDILSVGPKDSGEEQISGCYVKHVAGFGKGAM